MNQLSSQQIENLTKFGFGFIGVIILVMLLFIVAFYIYKAICISIIAKKTNTKNPWLAWIPIANWYLLVDIAGKPSWWFLLLFIPIVNLVVMVLVWIEICKKFNKPDWLGLLIVIPIANIILPGYLAFSEKQN